MVIPKYRWDFIGLSSQDKPTPQTSNKVVDGSTFYECDTSKLYVYCQDDWYERQSLGGSGGGDGIAELTTSDYNWPVSEPDGVALWKLETGIYKADAGIKLYINSNDKFVLSDGTSGIYDVSIVGENARIFSTYLGKSGMSTSGRAAVAFTRVSDGAWQQIGDIAALYTKGYELLMGHDIYNGLTQSNPQKVSVLSAYQGYLLNEKIGDLTSLNTTDKSSIVAAINELESRISNL